MDDRHVRILLRHAIAPLVVHCPANVRPPWLLPVFSVLLPNMHQRWAGRGAAGGGARLGGAAACSRMSGLERQLATRRR
jgi:hypothetical protein